MTTSIKAKLKNKKLGNDYRTRNDLLQTDDYWVLVVNRPNNGFNLIGLFQQYQIYDHAIHYFLTEEQTNRKYRKALL